MRWLLRASIESSRRFLSHFSVSSNNNERGFIMRSISGYNKLGVDSDNNVDHTDTEESHESSRDLKKQKSRAKNSQTSQEDEDDDEKLTCWVCDRSFPTSRILERHKRKERHWGCSICESVFQTPMALEYHREEADHWSDDEDDEPIEEDDFSMEDIEAIDNNHIDNKNRLKRECVSLL